MTKRDWWFGVVLVVLAFLFHAAFPRYAVIPDAKDLLVVTRFDRWSGRVEISVGIPTSLPPWLTVRKP